MAISKDREAPTISESNLSRLTIGLLLLICEQEMAEPGHAVMDKISFEYDVVQKRCSYCTDLERVLGELNLTTELIIEIDEQKQTNHKLYEPEEIINYYSGVFFNHVHQLKDKLIKLVDLMIAGKPFKAQFKERDMKVKSFLETNKDILNKIGIHELLKSWLQDDSIIGVLLKKRTTHHHRVSPLPLNASFLNIKLAKLMLNSESGDYLSEYGIQEMTKLNQASFKKLKEDTLSKQQHSIAEIKKNLDAIAGRLIIYYNIPSNERVRVKIGKAYSDFLAASPKRQ